MNWRESNWRINTYKCSKCRKITTTVEVDKGCTPAMISCPSCSATAMSGFYPKPRPVPMHIPAPTFEWYKPEKATCDHTRRGGLLMRPRTKATPIERT